MSYPNPCNFASPELGSAWYLVVDGTSRTVCQTTGFHVLANLYVEMQMMLQAGPLPTSGGTTIAASQLAPLQIDQNGVVSGEGWTVNALRALYACAQRAHAPADVLSSIASDLQIGRISPGHLLSRKTMQAAVWFPRSRAVVGELTDEQVAQGLDQTFRWGAGPAPSAVNFDTRATFPAFGSTPPTPSNHVDSNPDCGPEAALPAAPPIHVQGRLGVSLPLLLGLLAAALLGASLLGGDAPTKDTVRGRRANPSGCRCQGRRRNPCDCQHASRGTV